MIDKVQKIREEVVRIQLYTQSEVLKQVLDYIDEVQEEEIPPKFPLISQKKCMYTKDDFTDEDRKILCEDCEEECEYAQKKEPVSEDFELALAEMIDKAQKCVVEPWVVAAQWKDELIKLAKSEEPVSEELEDAAFDYAEACKYEGGEKLLCVEHFKAGAKWQFERVKEALLSEVLPCFMHGGEADEVVAKLDEVLNQKK